MADSRKLSKQYVSDLFDPVLYGSYVCTLTKDDLDRPGSDSFRKYRQMQLGAICKVFKEGRIQGDRLLDFGSGPSLDVVAVPALYFKQVYLSDFSPSCRALVQGWLDKKEIGLDWSYSFRYLAQLHSGGITGEEISNNLRKSIKGILICDALSDDTLDSKEAVPFDCIITSLCLEGCCDSEASYQQALTRVASLMAQGGHLVASVCLNDRFYCVGEYKIYALPLTLAQVKDAFTKAGLDIVSCEELLMEGQPVGFKSDKADSFGLVTIHAVRQK